MRSVAEKQAILKTVSIFNEAPGEVLCEAADLLVEIEVKAGEIIFEKGDLGNCMYIIADGRVRVHDGELVLNDLGKTDVFGEMAALDPNVRSASVTALEDSHLFRLEAEDLYALMAKRVGVARGIIHILSQRLRGRTQEMAEEFKYMQQFSRVTAAAVAVEKGIYVPESLDEVARRSDELGQLARVFQGMVRQVYMRELNLKRQVNELRIEIDEAKKAGQVAEITETEYFQELQKKAHRLRQERHEESS
jgi:CRP-like cAMP-binding protein